MSEPPDVPPRVFLRAGFSHRDAVAQYPSAYRTFSGGLFLSHAGPDEQLIRDRIISPVVHERFPGDRTFLHNRKSDPPGTYSKLVQAALHWCEHFLVALSAASVANAWVIAEVEWALLHSRPVLAARLDGTDWAALAASLELPLHMNRRPWRIFDFFGDDDCGGARLALALDELLAPHRRPTLRSVGRLGLAERRIMVCDLPGTARPPLFGTL